MKQKKLLGNLEIASFCEQTALIISAGIPAYEGIFILMTDAADKETASLLQQIYEPLEKGHTFHDALAISEVFPQYVIDMVELGELSGKLDEVLSFLKIYYEREEHIKNSFKHAVLYPLWMLFILFSIVLLLFVLVLPVFNHVYMELGVNLTGLPLIMMNFSKILNTGTPIILFFAIVLALTAFIYSKTNSLRMFLERQTLFLNIASGRFANCMSMAISSGLTIIQGLELAERLVDNLYMKARITKCKKFVEEGYGFADAILATKIFTKTYASLLDVGLKTGSLDYVLNKIFQQYEDHIDYEINRFVSRLEPALVIILSVIIGITLLSFLLPLAGIMTILG